MPNNNYEPTEQDRKTVERMASYGIKVDEICQCLINPHTNEPISRQTAYKYFRQELNVGMTKANLKVAESLFKSAVDRENVTAQIWWTKSRMGWSETNKLDHGGEIKISWDAMDQAIESYENGE